MNVVRRIELLARLGVYIARDGDEWKAAKEKAYLANPWFLPEFIDLSSKNIADFYLSETTLQKWVAKYPRLEADNGGMKTIGLVMAGNIPLVGFHDLLSVLISGNRALVKPSSKDEVLIKHLTHKLVEWAPELSEFIAYAELLKNCDAYIATGSNSTANYFAYYFGKYPHIIRKNRTSVAVLTGAETREEIDALASDVFDYFGMGCRNITKIYVPAGYDFLPMLEAFKKFDHLADHHKYKNNYDYNLALHILNSKLYMSTPALLLIEDENIFSPVSQLNYEFYDDISTVIKKLEESDLVQCIVGKDFIPFGHAQRPGLNDYADGVDTIDWLVSIQ